ncbi:hypothetical protein, partial [Salinibacter ruber]|uniref:hypothetical protein n=1 Tax=Salinibacter ruber TaxID=146919 RepID=UPI0021684BD7
IEQTHVSNRWSTLDAWLSDGYHRLLNLHGLLGYRIVEYTARIVQPGAADRWKKRGDKEVKKIMSHISETVNQVRRQEKIK